MGFKFQECWGTKELYTYIYFHRQKFSTVSPSVASDLVYLIGVIPRIKGIRICRNNTRDEEIIEGIAQGIRLAGERAMTMYCLTVTGLSAWF